jgi:preprotein translocase subunit SecE
MNQGIAGMPEGREAMARYNPLQFLHEVRQETAKVTWPTWKEVWVTTAIVLVMVTLASMFFLVSDWIIATVVKQVLSLGR